MWWSHVGLSGASPTSDAEQPPSHSTFRAATVTGTLKNCHWYFKHCHWYGEEKPCRGTDKIDKTSNPSKICQQYFQGALLWGTSPVEHNTWRPSHVQITSRSMTSKNLLSLSVSLSLSLSLWGTSLVEDNTWQPSHVQIASQSMTSKNLCAMALTGANKKLFVMVFDMLKGIKKGKLCVTYFCVVLYGLVWQVYEEVEHMFKHNHQDAVWHDIFLI